jgi:hypothetical protein
MGLLVLLFLVLSHGARFNILHRGSWMVAGDVLHGYANETIGLVVAEDHTRCFLKLGRLPDPYVVFHWNADAGGCHVYFKDDGTLQMCRTYRQWSGSTTTECPSYIDGAVERNDVKRTPKYIDVSDSDCEGAAFCLRFITVDGSDVLRRWTSYPKWPVR